MNSAELRTLLDATLNCTTSHVERMTVAAAVISELLRARGMETTLVDRGAIEFYAPETVLADRIIGFKHWRSSAYGAQSMALLAAFGHTVDEAVLADRLRAEDAEVHSPCCESLRRQDEVVNDAALQRVRARLDQTRDERRRNR